MPSKTSAASPSPTTSSSWLKSTGKLFSFLSGKSGSDQGHGHASGSGISGNGRSSSGSRNSMGARSKSHPGQLMSNASNNGSSSNSNNGNGASGSSTQASSSASGFRSDKRKKSKDGFGSKSQTPQKSGNTPTSSQSSPSNAAAPPAPSDTLNPYGKRSQSPGRPGANGNGNGGSSFLHPSNSVSSSHSNRPISPAAGSDRPGFHFQSLDRMSPPHSRSASPAPSLSSTLAAERLARLTDAQVADLAAQVSAESFRRRTPVGSLIAAYELSVQTTAGGGHGLSAASRLSMMSNDQFRVLANDLDAEASRRDIPGINTLGRSRAGSVAMIRTATGGSMSESMMQRDITMLRAKFGPNNPAAAEAIEATVLANSGSLSSSASPSTNSPIASAMLSSSPTGSSVLANGIPSVMNPNNALSSSPLSGSGLERSHSGSSARDVPTRMIPVGAGPAAASTLASSLPRSHSAGNIHALGAPASASLVGSHPNLGIIGSGPMSAPLLAGNSGPMSSSPGLNGMHPDLAMVDEDTDRTIWRSRLGSLPDSQFGALRRDLKGEMDRRKAMRRGMLVSPQDSGDEAEEGEGTIKRGASVKSKGGNDVDADSGFAASVIAAVNERTNAALPRTPPSSRPSSDEANNAPSSPTKTVPPTSAAGISPSPPRLDEMMKAIPSQDLWQLWEDTESETLRRAAGGIVVAGVSAADAAAVAAAAEQERAAAAAAAAKDKKKESRRAAASAASGGSSGAAPASSGSATEGKEAKEQREQREQANVMAWRSRIAKLTDEQMAEVTADVYDEMTRRRDKSAPFLPPRADLSPKRNEARKELSKLPSRELKMLWSIIHESIKKRKMVS
ncbi:component of the polarisome [Phlyctochytrium planicorne]|nr:component of the polarisome [Phlyctochytrium planicorne]